MSSRNLRKVCGDNGLPAPEDSDDDYQPLYTQHATSKFTYEGLELTSASEVDIESPEPGSAEEEAPPEPGTNKKNNKKKRRKQKKAKLTATAVDVEVEDEIDKSIKEVNALLGSPVAVTSSTSKEKPRQVLVPDVLLVQQKHLNVANELKRKFGSETGEERNRRGNRQAQLRIQKKCIIVPMMEHAAAFQKVGLSMSVQRREEGYVWFTFDHSEEYRRRQQRLLLASVTGRLPETSVEEAQRQMHIEGMLETADMMFRMDEFTAANTLIERSIAYMQYIAHPAFQLSDPQTRLSYLYMENRTFHIAVLKYLHLLTNRASHRTALELAKMLLNLDPTDPLAVLLIIDTLALRAREHQWLIDAVDHWAKERDAGFLFNIQFSYAMAHFHVATKSKGKLEKADELLRSAILRFPTVVLKLFECASIPLGAKLQAHPLFNGTAEDKITKNLKDLIFLYAKLTWSKWREPAVFEWLQRNANELADLYDADPATREHVRALSNEQLNLFRSWPDEVVRHLCVIKPMAALLVEGAVPHVSSLVCTNPLPPVNGINRYGYSLRPPPGQDGTHSALRELFSSLLPNYAAFAPPDLEQTVLDIERNNPALAMAVAYAGQAPQLDTEDDFEINFDEEDEEGEPSNLFQSIGALTRTVHHVIATYERGNYLGDAPEDDEQLQPGDGDEAGGVNGPNGGD